MEFKLKNGVITKDGHTMFLEDVVKELNNNYSLKKRIEELDSSLSEEVDSRDKWEEKATELATDVAVLLNVDIGEHSNCNCPVENAIEAVFQEKKAAEFNH